MNLQCVKERKQNAINRRKITGAALCLTLAATIASAGITIMGPDRLFPDMKLPSQGLQLTERERLQEVLTPKQAVRNLASGRVEFAIVTLACLLMTGAVTLTRREEKKLIESLSKLERTLEKSEKS